MPGTEEHYDVVVIGSGFGGSLTALGLARSFKGRGQGERVLMLERGTWWTTPVATVQDKQVKTAQREAPARSAVVIGGELSRLP